MKQLKIFFLPLFIAVFFLSPAFATAEIAVGTYVLHDHIEQPILITSDKNNAWSFIETSLPSAPNGAYLYNVICQNKNCIASGAFETEHYYLWHNNRRPLLMVSDNDRKTWSVITDIVGLPAMKDGFAPYVSCTDNTCIAVGSYLNNGLFPLLLVSNDNGHAWSYIQNISHLPAQDSQLQAVNCRENNCIASGIVGPAEGEKQLLFLFSKDKGQSWSTVQNIVDAPKKMDWADVTRIQCNNHTCVAAGYYWTHDKETTESHPLLLTSKNQGQSWTFIKEMPELSHLKSFWINDLIYTNGTFIAVGEYNKELGPYQSLILTSKDEGQSWSLVKNISNPYDKQPGMLNSISCTDNSCVAVGSAFYIGGFGFGSTLLVSKDNGQSWLLIPYIAGIPTAPDINTVQCTGNHCTAIGEYDLHDNSYPVILFSDNKGQSWSVQKNINDFPENIYKIHFSSTHLSVMAA